MISPAQGHPPAWNRRAAEVAARASFGVLLGWILLTTLLSATGPEELHFALDLPFRLLCHRLPERVLTFHGATFPLCSRCLGIWAGLSLGAALAWPSVSIKALKIITPIGMALMLAEVVTQDLGLHPVFHPTRLLSGVLLAWPIGAAVGGLIRRELRGQDSSGGPAAS